MRIRIVVLLGLLGLVLTVGAATLWASAPSGSPSSLATENLRGNRGLALSWDTANVSDATSYKVVIKKFPNKSRRQTPVLDSAAQQSRITSSGTNRSVDITWLIPNELYEFTVVPTNSSGDGPSSKIVKTAPIPTFVKGHQADHTVLYKHGTFSDVSPTLIQGALPGAASKWNGSVLDIQVCKDSSSCRSKNTDGGVITVKSVATTRDSHAGGCRTSFACVLNYTYAGSRSPIGKHIINANMVFESPAFTCDGGGSSCSKATRWEWTVNGTHAYRLTNTDTLVVYMIRVQYVALHEFGHTLGLSDFGNSSTLAGTDAIMTRLKGGKVTKEDKAQLKAIYARHSKHSKSN